LFRFIVEEGSSLGKGILIICIYSSVLGWHGLLTILVGIGRLSSDCATLQLRSAILILSWTRMSSKTTSCGKFRGGVPSSAALFW
jgi:hypothetical protein